MSITTIIIIVIIIIIIVVFDCLFLFWVFSYSNNFQQGKSGTATDEIIAMIANVVISIENCSRTKIKHRLKVTWDTDINTDLLNT